MLLLPQELCLDDIYGTPDRILFDRDEQRFVLDEVKATWMSCRGIDQSAEQILDAVKFQYWILQKKAYAAMLHFGYGFSQTGVLVRRVAPFPRGPDDLYVPTDPPVAVIRALFVNGGYDGTLAKPLAWEFRYTADELEQYWASLRRFRDQQCPPVTEER